MKKTILLTTALLTACLQIKAQTLATEYKGTASGKRKRFLCRPHRH